MNLKKQNAINGNRILFRNTEYYQEKKIVKAFQNIAAILKINPIDFSFFFICRASRICSSLF